MSELDVLRGAIDEVDRQIVALFERRMAVTQQVGEYKQAHDIPVLDARRERQVIANKLECLQNQDLRTDVTLLYETIMGISRRQQRRLVQEGADDPAYSRIMNDIAAARRPVAYPSVVYQGEPGAYSEMACMNFFGENVQTKGLKQFRDVFAAIKSGEADYGVLPIENTSTGAIRQIYDLLTEYDCYMVAHCLMALPGAELSDIQTV